MRIKSNKYHIITDISNFPFHLYGKRNFDSLHDLLPEHNETIQNVIFVYADSDFRISTYKNYSYGYGYNNFKDAAKQLIADSGKLLALHSPKHRNTYNSKISYFGDIKRYNGFIGYYNSDYHFK